MHKHFLSFSGIGVGLFLLAFIWVLALFVCVAFSRAQGGLANAGASFLVVVEKVSTINGSFKVKLDAKLLFPKKFCLK